MTPEEMRWGLPVVVRITGRKGKVSTLWADGSVSVRLAGGMKVSCKPEDLDPPEQAKEAKQEQQPPER